MNEEPDIKKIPTLSEGVSPLRYMMAETQGVGYQCCQSLEESRRINDAVLVMEGDDGGQIYLTCPVRNIKCSEVALRDLLGDIDLLGWRDISMAGLYYEVLPVGTGVAGGMRGGLVNEELWLHPWFDAPNLPDGLSRQNLLSEINFVLRGEKARMQNVTNGS